MAVCCVLQAHAPPWRSDIRGAAAHCTLHACKHGTANSHAVAAELSSAIQLALPWRWRSGSGRRVGRPGRASINNGGGVVDETRARKRGNGRGETSAEQEQSGAAGRPATSPGQGGGSNKCGAVSWYAWTLLHPLVRRGRWSLPACTHDSTRGGRPWLVGQSLSVCASESATAQGHVLSAAEPKAATTSAAPPVWPARCACVCVASASARRMTRPQ